MEKEIVYEGLGSPLQGEKCKVWKSQIEKKKNRNEAQCWSISQAHGSIEQLSRKESG